MVLFVFLNQATKGYYQAKLAAWLGGGLIVVALAFALIRQSRSQIATVPGFPQPVPYPTAISSRHEPVEVPPPLLKTLPLTRQPPQSGTDEAAPVVSSPPLDGPKDDGRVDPVPAGPATNNSSE